MATGTGVAPFLSYLRSQPTARPLAFLYGVRHAVDRVDPAWLQEQGGVHMAVSREVVPGCLHGRITGLLEQVPLHGEIDYYLCGLDTMIDEVTAWLEARGVPIGRIHRECFFNASYER